MFTSYFLLLDGFVVALQSDKDVASKLLLDTALDVLLEGREAYPFCCVKNSQRRFSTSHVENSASLVGFSTTHVVRMGREHVFSIGNVRKSV